MARLLGGDVELVKITTAGDVDRARGDKSRWVGALEAALLSGEIDLAVHSAKDVPGELAPGTEIAATPRRAEPFDVLVGEDALARVREGARVGTSALRRRAQLLAARPDLEILRAARERRHAPGQAGRGRGRRAGPRRRRARPAAPARARRARVLHDGVFVPAAGQGVIAVQARTGSPAAEAARAPTTRPTHAALDAERHVVRALEATCHTPVGVLATRGVVRGFVGLPDGSSHLLDEAPTASDLVSRLLAAGAADLLREAELAPMTCILVGAGPGDPGLLTVRARELIDAADVILYDRLIPPGVLDGVAAELVYVGKQGGGPQMPQEEIDRLLVQYGTGGRTVVRLKGGDPFVFGRGGEEALVLREAGIPYEVVPGRDRGDRRTRLRGRAGHAPRARVRRRVRDRAREPGQARDRAGLARAGGVPGTLVFYMGVKALPRIASQLIAGGRSAVRARRRRRARHAARARRPCSPRSARSVRCRASARRRSRSSGRSPRCASSSRGSRRARCTGARWP